MEKMYFDLNDTLLEITNNHKEAIDLLSSIGFENIRDEKQRKAFGGSVTLETALRIKKINENTFVKQLVEAIENGIGESDGGLESNGVLKDADLRIEGVLPCPVRVPMMEAFQGWMKKNGESIKKTVGYDLKAASMGVDWLKKSIESTDSSDVLADIFISAGFDLFFDKELIGKYKSENAFEDITGFEHYNKDFENGYIDLRDPDKHYSMIGVVPAVFLVNTEELGERKIPASWQDILSDEFANKVSLPIGDFDLFNAILLNINARYGETGVEKLGRSLLKSMHPSEMVKSHIRKAEKPIVTIMPYFFTKMTGNGGPMKAVWPSDGAIISPIFLLSKRSKAHDLKPFVDFFASKEVGEILSHNGRFPSVNPDVDNMIDGGHKYMWLGWDYINKNDIGRLIEKCDKLFGEAAGGVEI